MHARDPSTFEAERGGLQAGGQPGLHYAVNSGSAWATWQASGARGETEKERQSQREKETGTGTDTHAHTCASVCSLSAMGLFFSQTLINKMVLEL